jgi:mono/diheme cytochrome c family protein
VDGYFKALVLISFVVGAVTGVAMWFVSIQVSPRTIGMMVEEFHWVWAIEWTFFSLEITAGYCFYRFSTRLADRDRFFLLVIYTLASWFSLFWINGILSWQLTPGDWNRTHHMWSGFFNPGFLPSLLFRTVTAMTVASLAACVVINTIPDLDREARTVLINKAAHFLFPMAAMPVLSAWYFGTMPPDSRQMVFGGNIVMTLFMGVATGASVLIGLYAAFALLMKRLYINGATATLLVALSFAATAGGEFVREGVRKPFTVREALYATSMTPDEVARLRAEGCVARDPYPLRNPGAYPNEQVRLGARVFRFHCNVCHTMDGANAILHLAGDWTPTQRRMNIAQLQRTKTFMPPFAGTPEELEALVQLIEWNRAGRPAGWPESTAGKDWPESRARIRAWLDEVGVAPGFHRTGEPR